jgi:hypothetical protein
MSPRLIPAALLVLTFAAGAAHAGDADVMRAFTLLGNFAVDCATPAGPKNPYIVFADSGTRVTRTLKMGLPQLDGTFGVRAARRIDEQHIAIEIEDATHAFAKVVIAMENNVWHTERSEELNGDVLIKDGLFTGSGGPVPRFQHCPG